MELRGAQVTTGGRCNSRAYAPGGGGDMGWEVKGVKEGSVRGVRAGAWGERDGGREVQVDAHCRCLSHDVSDRYGLQGGNSAELFVW